MVIPNIGAFIAFGLITAFFLETGWTPNEKLDQAIDGKVPSGFEMIINNFSVGIFGGILCCLAYLVVGPAMTVLNNFLTQELILL